jgi:heat shock protein HslJ
MFDTASVNAHAAAGSLARGLLAAPLLAVLLLSGTTGASIAQSVPVQIPPISSLPPQGTWQWFASYRADGSITQPGDPSQYTIEFKTDGSLTIQADCNIVLGTYSQTSAGLNLQLGPTTLVACPPGSSAEDFKQDLASVTGSSQTNGQLLLRLGSGDSHMMFTPVAAPDLAGREWEAVSMNNGRGAIASLLSGTTLTLAFDIDRVSGTAGCNRFFGPYTRSGESIALGPLATTRVACDPAVVQQEAAYLAALEASTSLSLRGNQLWLADADGATQVIFVTFPTGGMNGSN